MISENKLNTLTELLKSIRSEGKRTYAMSIINELIDSYNSLEKVNDYIKAKKTGINPERYDLFIERCIDALQTLGFEFEDIQLLDKDALNFIKLHRHKIKKPLDKEYLLTLMNLYRYFEFTYDRKAENLTDLKNAYTEIENNRE